MTDRIQQEQAAPVDWQAIVKQRERELKQVGEARHRAEAAIARVRALADRWKRNGTRDLARYADIMLGELDHPGPEDTDTTPAELTADEARDLVDQLSTDLYKAQDRLAFIAECLDAAEEGGSNAVEIKRVRLWLDGPKCGMQLAAENPGLYEKITAMVSGPLPSPDATRTTPAATEATSAPDTITDPEWLKQQYAAAIRAVWEGWITDWASVDIPDPEGVLADAVLRVRDRHVQQLRQRLALAAELAGTVQAAKQRYAAEQDKPADGEVSVLEQLGYHAMGQALDLERVQAERDQLAKLLTVILGEFRNLPGTHTATAHVETETLNRWRAELDQHQEQP